MTKTFEDLGLSEALLKAVSKLKYETPTPVQEQAIPAALEGRDIIAGAQTGTGKTAAFCLPSMDGLPHCEKGCGPYMLVVTPTRELADQICEVCDQIAKVTKHKVAKFVGGVSYNPQKDALRRGIDVLIATPGRLEDLINQGCAKLDQVKILVLDEADRMVDMGFLPSITNIVDQIEGEHQTLLFSATIDRNVKRVSRELMNDPVEIEIARRGETSDNVEQYIIRINHSAKFEALEAILADRGANRVIVFTRTKHRVDNCARMLKHSGYKVETIHSDRSQAQRRKALANFDKGTANILVATDVLARGIDVSNVDYVVNYDMPMMAEDYIHRIGRTGRAGEKGFAVSLVSPETEGVLKDIQKLIKMTLPELVIEGFDRKEAEAAAKERRHSNKETEKDSKKSTAKAASAGKPKRDKRGKKDRDERDDDFKGKKRGRKSKDGDYKKKERRKQDDEFFERNGKKKDKGEAKHTSFEMFYKENKHKKDELRGNGEFELDGKKHSRKGGKPHHKKSSSKGDFAGKKGRKSFEGKRDGEYRKGGYKKFDHKDDRRDGERDFKKSGYKKDGYKSYDDKPRRKKDDCKGGFDKERSGKDGFKPRGNRNGNGGGKRRFDDKPRGGKGGDFKSKNRGGYKGTSRDDNRKGGYKKGGNGNKGKFRPGRYSSNRD